MTHDKQIQELVDAGRYFPDIKELENVGFTSFVIKSLRKFRNITGKILFLGNMSPDNFRKGALKMRLDLDEIEYGVTNSEKLIALFQYEENAKSFARTKPDYEAVKVDRNDWTFAALNWTAAETLKV